MDGRKGAQALAVKLLEAPPSVAELRRRPAEELHGLIEDMIKILEASVLPDLRRNRFRRRRPPRPWPNSSTPSPASSRSSPPRAPNSAPIMIWRS